MTKENKTKQEIRLGKGFKLTFTAEDTGRKVQGNQISIYVNNHAEVSVSDTENTDVYLAK